MPGRREVFALLAEGLTLLLVFYLTDYLADRFDEHVSLGILGVALGLAIIGVGLAGAWEAFRESKATRRKA